MHRTHGRARGLCPTKCSAVGRGPCAPPPVNLRTPCTPLSLRDQFANWSWQSAFPSLKALFAARKKGPASRQDPLSVSKKLAEFAARRRQRNEIIFSRDMCVRENTSQAASVLHGEVCHAGKTWWKSGKCAGVAGDTREQNSKILVANVTDLQENCCKCALMGLHCRKPVCRRIATKRRP